VEDGTVYDARLAEIFQEMDVDGTGKVATRDILAFFSKAK
jgi:hypothetical protein